MHICAGLSSVKLSVLDGGVNATGFFDGEANEQYPIFGAVSGQFFV